MFTVSPTKRSDLDDYRAARWLTYALFFIFAVTTDAVGVIIPVVVEEYGLTLTQAGSFHYATMIAIALAGGFFGHLADTAGRKFALLSGMGLFAAATLTFSIAGEFFFFLALIFAMGLAIGIFKTAALALVGDVSETQQNHTRTMNMAEGFFGVGAIAGPALVTFLLAREVHWSNLYVVAGAICLLVILLTARLQFPDYTVVANSSTSMKARLSLLADPYATGFSLAIVLYVIAEAAIYVWMPTYLASYTGSYETAVSYALTIFFVLRAGGRFLGAWALARISWKTTLTVFSGLVAACYAGAVMLGVDYAIWLLPLSGLFMSIIYPTLNSKGISSFNTEQHGAIAGILLFFTAAAAAVGPLIMALLGDIFGDVEYGFLFTMSCACALFFLCLANQSFNFTRDRLG
jgi:DHA1 family quinolone resistance protein-like MFS transporter